MKISRGPRSARNRNVTDSIASHYIESWEPGKKIKLDGTIDKDGTKHTTLELEIEESDILALFNALLNNHKKEISKLEEKLEKEKNDHASTKSYLQTCQKAFASIDSLIFHADEEINKEHLLNAVQIIAAQFHGPFLYSTLPDIEGIDWDSIKPIRRPLDYYFSKWRETGKDGGGQPLT